MRQRNLYRAIAILSVLALGLLPVFPAPVTGISPTPAAAQGDPCAQRVLDAGATWVSGTTYRFEFETSDQIGPDAWHYDADFDFVRDTDYIEEVFWKQSEGADDDGWLWVENVDDGYAHTMSIVFDFEQHCNLDSFTVRWTRKIRRVYFFNDEPHPDPNNVEGWPYSVNNTYDTRYYSGNSSGVVGTMTISDDLYGESDGTLEGTLPDSLRYIYLYINAGGGLNFALIDYIELDLGDYAPEPDNTCQDALFDFTASSEGWSLPVDLDEHWIDNADGVLDDFPDEGFTLQSDPSALWAEGYDGMLTDYLNAWYHYEETCSLYSVSVRFRLDEPLNYDPIWVIPPFNITLADTDKQHPVTEVVFQPEDYEWGTWLEYTWYPKSPTGSFYDINHINLFYGDRDLLGIDPLDWNTYNMGEIWIDQVAITVADPLPDTLPRPLAAEDEYAFGQWGAPYTYDFESAVTAFSDDWGDNVHNIAAGTVTAVQPLPLTSSTLCLPPASSGWGDLLTRYYYQLMGYFSSSGIALDVTDNACMVAAPDLPDFYEDDPTVLHPPSAFAADRFLEGSSYAPPLAYWTNNLQPMVVVVETTLGSFHYLVNDPTVSVGDSISAGCVLGYTTQLIYEDPDSDWNELQFFPNHRFAPFGLTLVALYDTEGRFTQLTNNNFTSYPVANNTPCSDTGIGEQCLNDNPQLANDAQYWIRTDPDGTVSLPDGGLRLTGTIYHEHVIALNPASTYSLIVEAHMEYGSPNGDPAMLQVSLGDLASEDVIEIPIPADGSTVRETIAPQTWPPNVPPDQYYLWLTPQTEGLNHIILTLVCISDGTNDVDQPSNCIFANPSFAETGGWTLHENVTTGDLPFYDNGSIVMPEDTSITQDVTLQPGNYTLAWKGRVYPSWNYISDPTIDSFWQWDYYGDSQNGTVNFTSQYWETGSAALTVSATTTAQFGFTALNATNNGQLQYAEVCLIAEDGTDNGGWQGCEACNYNTNGDVAHDLVEMITWIACVIENIWWCYVYPFYKSFERLFIEIVRGIGMLGRYLAFVAVNNAKIFYGYLLYIAGHIVNLGQRIAEVSGGTVYYIDGGGGMSFWDVLGALLNGLRDIIVTLSDNVLNAISLLLGFLAPVLNTLVNVIIHIINILTTLLSLLLAYVLIIPEAGAVLISAFTSTSAMPIPGAPDCSVYSSNPICAAIYVVDNTIFAGPAGMLIPILLAAATFWIAIWTIDRLSASFK